MKITETKLPGVYILEPAVFGDARGWFMESWACKKMEEANLNYNFVQDNHSYSASKGVLRGIHLQTGDAVQAKLVRCTRGAVLDVAVDLRRDSANYKKWVAIELSAENKRQLLIPAGFGHGFLTLTEDSEFQYKVDSPYNPAAEVTIRWNDPELAVDWGIQEPILSERDANAAFLCDLGGKL